MGREFELKFAASAEILQKIQADFGNFTAIAMETTYYDTPDGALSARRITLRRRMENGRSVCTLKTPAPGRGRGEWEVEADSIASAVDRLWAAARPDGLDCPDASRLHAVCGARFTRLAKTIPAAGCTVELALDRGVLTGGGRETPLCEVEAELKSGGEAAAAAWAEALAEKYGLRPEPKSKFRRALALAEG
ncbi:MAG: CYTH domain-containing protein [Firmicutes bacterium]|nr:CYTH domain-containing protein [Bacillota bacterium]